VFSLRVGFTAPRGVYWGCGLAIITTANYKTYKGISASTYDGQLDVIIPAAQSAVEQWCGRVFDSASYTEKVNGNDWHRIVVKNAPITALTSITLIGPDGTSEVLDSSTYTFEAETGIIGFQPASEGVLSVNEWGESDSDGWDVSPKFSDGFQNLSVVYTGGYSAGTMPAGLKLAMYQYVDVLMAQAVAGVGTGAFKSERLGDYNYERMTGEESEALMVRLFGPWRRAIP
jgi:hypothetical protein